MKSFLSALISFALVASVSAHGELTSFQVGNGKTFNRADAQSAIRVVSSQDPNHGASNPALNCGPSAQAAALNAQAQPGDTMTFGWQTASFGAWPHNTGPVITYMASCGSTTCDKFDSTTAKWFKIDEKGRKNDGSWFQGDMMNGATLTATIPQTLAPGNYMVRHDVIALHLATSEGGAEFYPGCAQIALGGSGTGAPSADELVAFPGGYSDTDPGILDPSVFDAAAAYQMPGPPIAKLAATAGTPTSSPSAGAPDASGTSAPSSPAAGDPTATSPAAPAATQSGSHHHHCGSSNNQKRNIQKRVVSRQPTPVPEIADEIPEGTTGELLKDLKALTGVKARHLNSRIARRVAFEASH